MGFRLSEDAAFTLAETADIGGTAISTAYVSMEGFNNAMSYVEIGTWNAGDDLDVYKIQQATDSSGTGVKDLTTSGSGSNYDSDAPLDADGNFGIIEIKAENLDTANGFTHIRVTASEAGNSGADNATVFLIRYNAQHKEEQKNGTAVSGEKFYYLS